MMLNTISQPKNIIRLLTAWQLFAVLMVAVFAWPQELAWVSCAALAVWIVASDTRDGLLALIVMLPFSVILPNPYTDTLTLWRPLFFLAFAVWGLRHWRAAGFRAGTAFRRVRFLPWDKYLYAVGAVALASSAWAVFRTPSVLLFGFWLNAILLYFLLVQSVRSREDVLNVIRYSAASLLLFVAAGFVQLIVTNLTSLDTFWVYWADTFTESYYGTSFTAVSLYSNSWFSFTGGRGLRMFGVMPDSQSFAYVSVYAIGITTVLAAHTSRLRRMWRGAAWLSGAAVVFSGTRAVWVGMVASAVSGALAYGGNFFRSATKKMLYVQLCIVALIFLLPFASRGLQYFHAGGRLDDDFLRRARSSYDLNEASNAGRLIIWKESARYALTHPLGTGAANFLVSVVRPDTPREFIYENVAEQKDLRYNLPQKYVTAHNLYLHIVVELGVLGLLVFAAFWVSVGRQLWRFLQARRHAQDIFTFFVVQAALVFLWLGAAAFFDVTWLNDKALIFFFIELALTGIIVQDYESLHH